MRWRSQFLLLLSVMMVGLLTINHSARGAEESSDQAVWAVQYSTDSVQQSGMADTSVTLKMVAEEPSDTLDFESLIMLSDNVLEHAQRVAEFQDISAPSFCRNYSLVAQRIRLQI